MQVSVEEPWPALSRQVIPPRFNWEQVLEGLYYFNWVGVL